MPVITHTHYVEINSVPLATPAWVVMDMSPLWDAPGLRGGDRRIPYEDGEQPLRRFLEPLRVVVPLLIRGDRDQDNAAYSNTMIGLQTNLDYLRSNILTPSTSDPGTWPIVLHMPDSTTRSSDCFVIPPLQIKPIGRNAFTGVLDILVPSGVFS